MRVCPRCGLKYPNDDAERCFVDGAALDTIADPRIGTLIGGRYLIEGVLGAGGMATVYRARHTLVDRPVAVKIMDARFGKDADLRERFRREARSAASIAHPNIIEISDHGETDDGTLFMVMELLDGVPLTKLIAMGPMPPKQVAALGLQIARGIARAHDFQVIHRDLKPDNVFIATTTRGQRVKLLDFGIARSMHDSRLTSQGQIFGTPQYMAPERVTSIDAGPGADLYALGVILFEMLTGRLPFLASDVTGYLIAHLQQPPPLPSSLVPEVPRRLEELILALLEKDPAKRPVDAHPIVRELGELAPREARESALPLGDGPSRSIAPTLPPTTLERWAKRSVIFEQMTARAFPQGNVPPEVRAMLDEIRGILERVQALRSAGLKEQRRLDQLSETAREGRERLGHAVEALGVDLSSAREGLRAAHVEVEPYLESAQSALAAYRESLVRLQETGAATLLAAPSSEAVAALRDTADALDRWLLAHGAEERAHRWLGAKETEARDLEFQVQTLGAQLEKLEASTEAERAALERLLRDNGNQVQAHEDALLKLASRFVAPLRARPELGTLFQQLEHERGT